MDQLEAMDYVVRRPDPTDRRAKLIVLTDKGRACIQAGRVAIQGIEEQLTEILGDAATKPSALFFITPRRRLSPTKGAEFPRGPEPCLKRPFPCASSIG